MSHAQRVNAGMPKSNAWAAMSRWLRGAWFPTFRALHRWWRDRFTVGGKIVAVILIICAPGVWAMHFGHLYLFTALAMMLLLCWLANWLFAPKFSVRALPPLSIDADRPFDIPLRIRNRRRLPAFDLRLTFVKMPPGWEMKEPPEFIGGLAAGARYNYTPAVVARQRGKFKLPPLQATSYFPMNFFRRPRQFAVKGSVLVLPRYNRMELPVAVAAGQSEGSNPNLQRGASCDVTGIREYQPGIPVRRWDYASWARLGYPVVREYEDSQQQLATIVLDNFATREEMRAADFEEQFEASVSRAASVAEALAGAGITIESLWIDGEKHVFETAAGENGFMPVMIKLALAQPRVIEADEVHTQRWELNQKLTTYLVTRNNATNREPGAGTNQTPVVLVKARQEDIELNRLPEASK